MSEKELMLRSDVAKLLGVNPRLIDRWADEEGLPCYRPGQVRMYDRAEVLEWIESRKQGADNV